MILPKLVSSKEIYEYVYSRMGTQVELMEDDFKLWVAECYGVMALPQFMIKKIIGSKQDPNFAFTNYQVPLPCDFVRLLPSGLAVNGQAVLWSQDSFQYLMDGDCCDLTALNNPSLEIIEDAWGNQFSPFAGTAFNSLGLSNITFDIQNGKITFNIKEGDLCMSYYAIPMDSDGYLMIPDNEKIKRAFTDYVIWCLDYIAFRQGSISLQVYKISEELKNWSMSSAISAVKNPDMNQLEAMKQDLIRLLPRTFSYYNFYKDLSR